MVRVEDQKILTEAALPPIVKREVAAYAAVTDAPLRFVAVLDDVRHTYAVVIVPQGEMRVEQQPSVYVMARIENDYVIIEEDTDDKPLHEALMHNGGIPRAQIVLAYAGEPLPEPVEEA